MAYPQGTPSEDFATGVYTSDFSPTVICGGVIDNYTPVSNAGLKHSVGYQLSLTQNFVNQQYLGRDAYRIDEGWINTLYASGINLDSTDEHATIISSGVMHLMSPESSVAGMTISGNYIGVNKYDPEYEIDVDGAIRASAPAFDGILLTGDNGFINRIKSDATEESELYIQTENTTDSFIHLNPQVYGGVSIADRLYITGDEDVWSWGGNFTSGVITWSDCEISGFSSFDRREIHARKVGRQITLYFQVSGTSDSDQLYFELPATATDIGSGNLIFTGMCRGMDNSTSQVCSWWINPGEAWIRFSSAGGGFENTLFTDGTTCGIEGVAIYESE
jgi:hypothetical protein